MKTLTNYLKRIDETKGDPIDDQWINDEKPVMTYDGRQVIITELDMKEVPNIISNKDLLYIKDMLEWNLLINKKIYLLMDFVTDEDISKLLRKVKKIHAKHYEELIEIFE